MWTDLTDCEIEEIRDEDCFWVDTWPDFDSVAFALAIQKALRIKNGAAQ